MSRSKTIDILRAIAVFLVLGRHMPPRTSEDPSFISYLLDQFSFAWFQGGWVGVDLFFVLSGFLVSGLLFRDQQKFGHISAANFLIRRGLKIYPAFWFLIAVTSLVMLNKQAFHLKSTLCELFFIQNYGYAIWNHTWSLAVEEHFYIFILVLLIALSKKGGDDPFSSIPAIFAVLAVVLLGLRILTLTFVPYSHHIHLFPTHLRIDSLLFGVVISYFYHYRTAAFMTFAQRFRRPAIMVGVLALAPAFLLTLETSDFIPTSGLTFFYLGAGLILIGTLGLDQPRTKLAAFIGYIGSHSYSIYLWHMPVVVWCIPWLRSQMRGFWNWDLQFFLYFTLSIAGGIAMSVLIEFPILRLRDRWIPSKARGLSTSLPAAQANPGAT